MRSAEPECCAERQASGNERGNGLQRLLGRQPSCAQLNLGEECAQTAAGLLWARFAWPCQGDETAGGMPANFRHRLFNPLHHAGSQVILRRELTVVLPPVAGVCGIYHLEAVAAALCAAWDAANPRCRAGERAAAAGFQREPPPVIEWDRPRIGRWFGRRCGRMAALLRGPMVEIVWQIAWFVHK